MRQVGILPHLREEREIVKQYHELSSRLIGVWIGEHAAFDLDLQVLVFESLRLIASHDDRNIAVDRNVLLRFGPWRLDRYENIVSAEDFSGFVVNLFAGLEEAQVEIVFLVVVDEVLRVVRGAQDFMVNGFANFAWDFKES